MTTFARCGLLLCCVVLLLQTHVSAADVLVGRRVSNSELKSLGSISHEAWDQLLQKYVDQAGMVDYGDWKNSSEDIQRLDKYLDTLSLSDNRGTREQVLAYWINAYNAVTIRGILREYPTSSIRNHTAVLFGYNIWKNLKLITSEGSFSLDEIEHEILRKMKEPRIHFAIVCASKGCPRLLSHAYTAEQLDRQLAENAQAFFADEQKFQYVASQKLLRVSPILDWFAEDFGGDSKEVQKSIARWLPTATARQAAIGGACKIEYLDYDWGLNDRK